MKNTITPEEKKELLREAMAANGSRGGKANVAKHGREHMRRIGMKGWETQQKRLKEKQESITK